MILDQLLYFSDNQAVLADGISNVIDRGSTAPVLANFSPGFAGDLFLVVQTGAAFTGATALEVKLASDSTADLPLLKAAKAPVVVNPKHSRVEFFGKVLPAGTPILNWGCKERGGKPR